MIQLCSIHHEFAVTQYIPGACVQWSESGHNADKQLVALGTRCLSLWPWYGQFEVTPLCTLHRVTASSYTKKTSVLHDHLPTVQLSNFAWQYYHGSCHRENSPITETTPEPTLSSWGGWPCRNKICSKPALTWKLTLVLTFPAHCISN